MGHLGPCQLMQIVFICDKTKILENISAWRLHHEILTKPQISRFQAMSPSASASVGGKPVTARRCHCLAGPRLCRAPLSCMKDPSRAARCTFQIVEESRYDSTE